MADALASDRPEVKRCEPIRAHDAGRLPPLATRENFFFSVFVNQNVYKSLKINIYVTSNCEI